MDHVWIPEPFDAWSRRSLAERLQYMAFTATSFDRRRREYKRMGWVYVMQNPALKDRVFKVGLSSRFPTERAAELSRSTGVLGEFQLVYFVHTGERHAAEREAHSMLNKYRVTQSKEFFDASLGVILQALDMVAAKYPLWAGPKRNMKPLIQPFLMDRVECSLCGSKSAIRELLIPVRAKCTKCGSEF